MPGSTDMSDFSAEDITLGALGTYEDEFINLISEAVTSGRAVRADRLTHLGRTPAARSRTGGPARADGCRGAAG